MALARTLGLISGKGGGYTPLASESMTRVQKTPEGDTQ